MEKTMKAFVVESPKKWGVKEVPIPKPGKGEVLIKMETSGICHTDLHAANGDWPIKPKYPLIPGHEGIGIVAELGEGCKRLKIGDRVALAWLHDACGKCEYCKSGEETLCPKQNMTAYTKDGSFGEYAIGNEDFVGIVPEKLDVIAGAPIVCAGVTTYKAVKRSNAKKGDWIAVVGVGGLGQLAIQSAVEMGINVIGVDVDDKKIELALKSGAKFAVNSRKEDPVKFVQSKTGGEGVKASILTAVHPIAFEQGFQMLKRGGRAVTVGLPAEDKMEISIFFNTLLQKEVVGSIVGTRKDLQEILHLAADGKVKSEVTKVVNNLEDIDGIFDQLEKGTFVGRSVIDYRK